MSNLTVERGFNGVAFVKVNDKPALSISSYGNRALAMRILDMMVAAPELVENLAGLTAQAQRTLAALDAGEPIDDGELRRWVDRAGACLAAVDIATPQ